jgi:TubC N-terminal docking domain
MTVDVLLVEATRLGIVLRVAGDYLRIQAPKGVLTDELRAALTVHKPAILRRLTAPPLDALGEPCPACGGKEKWRWLGDRMVCRACLIRSDPPPTAAPAATLPPGRRRPWW